MKEREKIRKRKDPPLITSFFASAPARKPVSCNKSETESNIFKTSNSKLRGREKRRKPIVSSKLDVHDPAKLPPTKRKQEGGKAPIQGTTTDATSAATAQTKADGMTVDASVVPTSSLAQHPRISIKRTWIEGGGIEKEELLQDSTNSMECEAVAGLSRKPRLDQKTRHTATTDISLSRPLPPSSLSRAEAKIPLPISNSEVTHGKDPKSQAQGGAETNDVDASEPSSTSDDAWKNGIPKATRAPTVATRTSSSNSTSTINLAHFIINRQVWGSRPQSKRRIRESSTRLPSNEESPLLASSSRWGSLSCVKLPTGPSNESGLMGKVTHIAWDPDGVLVAMVVIGSACNAKLLIYDWDMVVAAEIQARRLQQRYVTELKSARINKSAVRNNPLQGQDHPQQPQKRVFHIDPIFSIPLLRQQGRSHVSNGSISHIQWNPFNHDEIAVISRVSGVLSFIDLQDIAEWQQQSPQSAPPPLSSLLATGRSNQSSTNIIFVEGGVVLSNGPYISYHRRSCNGDRKASQTLPLRLIWEFTWRPTVSCAVLLSPTHLLLAAVNGTFMLLRWNETQRGAFSIRPTPIIVKEWTSYGIHVNAGSAMGLLPTSLPETLPQPTQKTMGIRSLWASSSGLLSKDTPGPRNNVSTRKKHDTSSGRILLKWVTNCGWLLSAHIELCHDRVLYSYPGVVHKSTRLQYVDSTGARVSHAGENWSLPARPVVSCQNENGDFLIEKVPDMFCILPPHDQRVLSSQSSRVIQQDLNKPTMIFASGSNVLQDKEAAQKKTTIHSISLSKRKGNTTAVALHPTGEWLLVGTEKHGVYVMSARAKGCS